MNHELNRGLKARIAFNSLKDLSGLQSLYCWMFYDAQAWL